jgi:hypothetical protein
LRFRFGNILGSKKFIGRIIVTNIPKILGHGHDERSDNEDGKDGRVLA